MNILQQLRQEYRTIIPHYRKRRGLLNVVGDGLKFLFGTMDDDDAQQIENYLRDNKDNNKNLITQTNKQIRINTEFNDQITFLISQLNTDHEKIALQTNTISKQIRDELAQFKYETLLKENINYLINNIQKIKEVMMSSRLNILSRDILTYEEIENNKINIEDLKELKLNIAIQGKLLLLIIDIPRLSENNYKNILIKSIPNKGNKLQLRNIITNILTYNNTIYYPTKNIKNLQLVNDTCIKNIFEIQMDNCTFEQNNNEQIIPVTNSIILAINIKKQNITQNCNSQKIEVEGTYLIKIANCQININNLTFSNYETKYTEHIILPNILKQINYIDITNLTLDKIHGKTIENLQKLEEIQTVHYTFKLTNYITLGIIIIFLTTLYICKLKKTKKTCNTLVQPQVLFSQVPVIESQSRGVTTDEPHTSLFK